MRPNQPIWRNVAILAAVVMIGAACGATQDATRTAQSTQESPATEDRTEQSVETAVARAEICSDQPSADAPMNVASYLGGASQWIALAEEPAHDLLNRGQVTAVNTEGATNDFTVSGEDRLQLLMVDTLNARTGDIDSVYFRAGWKTGSVLDVVVVFSDGRVEFDPGCGERASFTTDFERLAEGLRAVNPDLAGASDRDVLDMILTTPMTDRSALVDNAAATPEEPTAWEDLSADDRMLSLDSVPADVRNSLTFVPNALVTIPPQWADQDVLLCTRLAIAWAGHCDLTSRSELNLSLYLPEDGVVEFWLVQEPGRTTDGIAKLGELSARELLDTYRGLSPTEALTIQLSSTAALDDAKAGQAETQLSLDSAELAPTTDETVSEAEDSDELED